MLLTRTPPRLAPDAIRRPRLERVLAQGALLPLRLIVAPAGCGKTTLVLQYLANSDGQGAYCALEPGTTVPAFCAAIGRALNLPRPPANYIDLLVAMRQAATKAPIELAIDDIGNATPEAREMALKIIENIPEGISLIYIARSRDAADTKHWMARGLASLCDARKLLFTSTDITLMADNVRVGYSHNDIARLLEESDGWAIVVSGAIRAAAEEERTLHDAYERWRSLYGEVFLDFVSAEAERATPEESALVRSLVNGVGITDPNALHRLEANGLFVFNDNGVLRPFRAIQQARAVPIQDIDTSIPMVIRMLGRFNVSIGGREIEWVRRRDQQLVKYLLMRPGASATRAELAATFWPGAEKQLAMQSVRTACSNIRKALAGAVGYARVDRYFRAAADTVVLDLSTVVTDVGRFTAHAMAGDSAFERRELGEAAKHYEAAEKIYAGRLFDEDAMEPWFASQAKALSERLGVVLERLAEAAYDKGDLKHASEYAYRAKMIHPEQPALMRLLTQMKEHPRPA